MSANVLIYVELTEGRPASIAAELAGIGGQLARDLGGSLEAVVIGSSTAAPAAALGPLGVTTVYAVEGAAYAHYQQDPYLAALAAVARQAQPAVFLLGQTFQGRDLAPRLAFRLETGIVMDCVELNAEGGSVVMEKPMYGGNARARMRVVTSPQMATIRAKAFAPATPGSGQARVVPVAVPPVEARARLIERVRTEAATGVKLEDAPIVVSGGRGMGSAEAFEELERLAALLKGAVGASRGAVDAGFQATERQIGLSGKVVSPDLYIAVALSGAAQHMAGCAGARTIVAINRDPDASIFRSARFGVVGDWKQILPAFTEKVRELVSG